MSSLLGSFGSVGRVSVQWGVWYEQRVAGEEVMEMTSLTRKGGAVRPSRRLFQGSLSVIGRPRRVHLR